MPSLSETQAGFRAGTSLKDLAGLVNSPHSLDVSLGIAACNAHYNRFDLAAETGNGLDPRHDLVEGEGCGA